MHASVHVLVAITMFCFSLAPLVVSLVIFGPARAAVGNDTSINLYFSLVVSSSPALNTTGVVSEVDRTLELINSVPAILPAGYLLAYSRVLTTQVRP